MRAFESEHFTSRYDAEEWCEQHMQGKRELFKLNGHRAGNITLKISEKAFAEAVKDMGVFMLLTSKPTDGMEALMINKKRDAAEKIFDTLRDESRTQECVVMPIPASSGWMRPSLFF